jgi:hypothetical protein
VETILPYAQAILYTLLELMPSPSHQAILGIPKNRLFEDGRQIKTIGKKGQQVKLSGLKDMVTAAWFYLERS